jgi:hypothetical protein
VKWTFLYEIELSKYCDREIALTAGVVAVAGDSLTVTGTVVGERCWSDLSMCDCMFPKVKFKLKFGRQSEIGVEPILFQINIKRHELSCRVEKTPKNRNSYPK